MKVHYINILLFALPLNILVNSPHKKPSITPHHTPKIPTTRLLCECELYTPANYDNDQDMKKVMENFNKQTQQRFEEYEERLQSKRMQRKDKCDKEIQKIILKDKLEKELMDKFATLQTDIQNDALPTCICEKSLADKTEKFCLNCGKNMGAIAPWWGLVCGAGYAGWTNYFATTVVKMATDAGISEGLKVGLEKVTDIVGTLLSTTDKVIILKDKLEKELMDKFATLQTDIQNDALPTCICEKSLADKTEKFCLNCGKNMGAIAPWWGLVCGAGYAGWTNYFATTVVKMATDAGISEGLKVGLEKVTDIVGTLLSTTDKVPAIEALQKITAGKFTDGISLHGIFKCISSNMNGQLNDTYPLFSTAVDTMAKRTLPQFNSWNPTPVAAVEKAFADAQTRVLTQAGNVTSNLTTGITASIVAIVVIVLVMIIIYLILRYRRKKKMKKKLQYIKLLEE
ncbi:rifin [Plasmodium reichenowi]|uniref:Rifin n=1 Tax=Plasmodium reichenowi TaxID=5854 RepID=A0A060RM07_PLARE|nr:rifin [Plasmodium reichenowi]